jgi:hypothetical protein
MSRSLVTICSAILIAILVGCSELPTPTASLAPAEPLAFVSPTTSEADRASYRLAPSEPIVPPTPIVAPATPESIPLVETRFAVVPERLASIDVWSTPSSGVAPLITFDRHDEFDQVRVFRILADRGSFYEVQVPMRPNGSIGYVLRDEVEVRTTDQRILIDLSDRSVIVWNAEEVVFGATGTVGAPSTPTPTGSFYVRNVFAWNADSVYGPYVIPLSAYSEAIDQINGGDAVVAIHGTVRPDLVGAAASLGCIRLENDVLRELAAIVEPGAPVEIVS